MENKPQDFLDLYALANPLPGARAKVPLLEVTKQDDRSDPFLLVESLVIVDYLAETYNGSNSMLPPTARERAIMRLFSELCGSSFSYLAILQAQGREQGGAEKAVEAFAQGLVGVDAFLKHYEQANNQRGPFVLGERFSRAECNAAPFVYRACVILPAFTGRDGASSPVDPRKICDERGLVHLKRWIEAVLARPSVIKTSIPKEQVIESTSRLLERIAAMSK